MPTDRALLQAARAGDGAAFDRLVTPHRPALRAHAYRMLASFQDAEDAVQDALLGAWAGLRGMQDGAAVRPWLLGVATRACLEAQDGRPPRGLPEQRYAPVDAAAPLPEPAALDGFVGPCLDADLGLDGAAGPARESVELAAVSALQELPGPARAAVLLRGVEGLDAPAVATVTGTAVAEVEATVTGATAAWQDRAGGRSQQDERGALGEAGERDLLAGFAAAWERHDADGVAALLTEDARCSMPPLPAWVDGAAATRRLLAAHVLTMPWRVTPAAANGQLALAGHQRLPDGTWALGALTVLTLRDGRVAQLTCFLDAAALSGLDLPAAPPDR